MSGLTARLALPSDRPVRCLVIGAHPDDIEIGAGGTILRLIAERPDTALTWVVLSGDGERATEAEDSARTLAGQAVTVDVRLLDGRDGYLPYGEVAPLKEALAEVASSEPDLVLVHRHDDAHQDHRLANELAWQLFRRATILEYEIPKWDGDLGRTNLYVTLDGTSADRKVEHILRAFPSQRARDWFTAETFRATLRLRGIESRSPSGLAEAFIARKVVI
jgi:LmbE family N-acetylglucosaminyl deacetylase